MDIISNSIVIECNEDEDYIVYSDAILLGNRLENCEYKKILPVELTNILQPELENSLKLTNKALLQKDTVDSQKTFIHTLLSIMALIIDNDVPSISLKKYIPLCQSLLTEYIQKVEQRYPDLISKEKTSYSKYLAPKNPTKNHSLKMIPSKFSRLSVLLEALKEQEFIEKNLPLETFKKAFDGSVLEKPLGIKWIKMSQGKCFYGSALELIEQLEKKKFIDKFNNRQLSNIFIQRDGSLIIDWKGAKNRKNNTKKGRGDFLEDIEAIVNNF